MEGHKSLTFDKAGQDALPQHIKDKMKANQEASKKDGMEKIEIYRFQADLVANALRLVDITLNCHTKETCLDREVMQAIGYIKNCLSGNIDERVNRL